MLYIVIEIGFSSMNLNLKDKKILILGASKGIGRATTLALSKEKAKLIAVARSKNKLDQLKDESLKNGAAFFEYEICDVINEDMASFTNMLLKKYGHFDIIIHCIGTSLTSRNYSASRGEWLNALDINVLHALDVNSVIIEDMIKNNIKGHILHVSSISGKSLRGNPLYASCKAFLNAYISSVGREVANKGIVLNGVMPGAVSFEDSYWDLAQKQNDPKVNDFIRHHQAIGRFGTTEEIANLIVFLVSDLASFTTGDVLPIDGGTM